MPDAIKPYVATVLAAIIFIGGWTVSSWRSDAVISDLKADHAVEMKAVSDAAAAKEAEHLSKQKEWQAALADLDKKYFKEMDDARTENDRLRGELADGSKRVFIDAKCPDGGGGGGAAPGTAGLGNGAARAELNPKVARALVGITGDGDKAIRKLTALQEYIIQVCTK